MIRSNWLYIAVMFAVSYTIRILPLTLIRKPIRNQFIQSFLYYVPYVTLAVMTFPAIVNATQSPAAGAVHEQRKIHTRKITISDRKSTRLNSSH